MNAMSDEITRFADSVLVLGTDSTPDPVTTEAVRARLAWFASLSDAELDETLATGRG